MSMLNLEERIQVLEADLRKRQREEAKREYVRQKMIKVYEKTAGKGMERQEKEARLKFQNEWEELNK